jgi:hypothetical protein
MIRRQQTDLRMTGFGGRDGLARAASLLALLRRWRERNVRAVVAPRLKPADAPSNTGLASLAGGDLAARFHAWRGRSGRRYICSVFPVDHRAADAGLPEFAEAIVIAVGQDIGGERRIVAFLQCEYGANALARQAFVAAAIKAGARQWHVHLLTADPQKRRAAIEDIEALCRPVAPVLAPV